MWPTARLSADARSRMSRALLAEHYPLLAAAIAEELAHAWPDLQVCEVAHDGRSAWHAFEQQTPEIVFADGQMPGLDGLGALPRQAAGRSAAGVAIQRPKRRIGERPADPAGLWSGLPPPGQSPAAAPCAG